MSRPNGLGKGGNLASDRGASPKTFYKWVLSSGRKGCKRFRVYCEDGETRDVAYRNATATAGIIERMKPSKAEALDSEGAIVRTWDFPEDKEPTGSAPPNEEEPGYTKDPADTDEERVLKTFAHLLADAHRIALKQITEVVSIQSAHFAEERKSLVGLRSLNEKLMNALARKTMRVRIAQSTEDGGQIIEEQDESEQDTFLQDLLGPMLKSYVARQVAAEAPSADPTKKPNGA